MLLLRPIPARPRRISPPAPGPPAVAVRPVSCMLCVVCMCVRICAGYDDNDDHNDRRKKLRLLARWLTAAASAAWERSPLSLISLSSRRWWCRLPAPTRFVPLFVLVVVGGRIQTAPKKW